VVVRGSVYETVSKDTQQTCKYENEAKKGRACVFFLPDVCHGDIGGHLALAHTRQSIRKRQPSQRAARKRLFC
jgi:hypothetical protein